MESLIAFLEQYGLLAVFVGVFAEQAGAPIPAFPLLMLAGMQAHDRSTYAVLVLLVVTIASTVADYLWFWGGRRYGQRVLLLLCKLAISPDTCVRQNHISFTRYGVATLVIAKFVPGLSTLARPMAGALGMSTQTFMIFNLAGTVLWAGSGIVFGIVFHQQIHQVLHRLEEMGWLALIALAALLGAYIAFRLWRRIRLSRMRTKLSHVSPAELAELLETETEITILDVQSPAFENIQSSRIRGAIHLDLTSLQKNRSSPKFSTQAFVVVYCSCPNDVSAVKAAYMLGRRGVKARVLTGGIDAWIQSGLPLE